MLQHRAQQGAGLTEEDGAHKVSMLRMKSVRSQCLTGRGGSALRLKPFPAEEQEPQKHELRLAGPERVSGVLAQSWMT